MSPSHHSQTFKYNKNSLLVILIYIVQSNTVIFGTYSRTVCLPSIKKSIGCNVL